MTRAEHLNWCKARAFAYVDAGQLDQAFASMASDLTKDDSTAASALDFGRLGMPLKLHGHLSTPEQMRKFIEGFN